MHLQILIILIIIILLTLFYYLYNKSKKEIPKIIWTFWHDENIPDIVIKCINTWKKYNPKYDIIILNKTNLSNYLPDVDFSKIKHIESIQRFSDMVRLHILAKYGGIWSDASIICLKSYDSWIPYMKKLNDCELVGFYIDGLTLPELKYKSPVIENWFFACEPNSEIVNDWLNEFLKISNFDSVEQYIDDVKSRGINLQRINIPEYLSMHVALQTILQNPNKKYKYNLLKAEDTALKHLVKNDWNGEKSINNLLECGNKNTNFKCDIFDTAIIKLRGGERNELEKQDYSYFLENI